MRVPAYRQTFRGRHAAETNIEENAPQAARQDAGKGCRCTVADKAGRRGKESLRARQVSRRPPRASAASTPQSSTGRRLSCRAARASCCGRSSTSKSGTSARPMPRQVLPAPTGAAAPARRAAMELARIRHAGRRVALLRTVQARGIRPTLAINARVCEDYTRVAEEAKRAGWEFMGHAYDQMPMHKHDDQRAMIHRSMDILAALHRQAPDRLARPRPDADLRDARPARRGRREIYRRLGL